MDVMRRWPLTRLPATPFGLSCYFHPNGYVIECQKRGWSERGRPTGRHHDPPPALYTWTVYNHIALRRSMLEGRPPKFLAATSDKPQPGGRDFDTLREARAWCDANVREGWERA